MIVPTLDFPVSVALWSHWVGGHARGHPLTTFLLLDLAQQWAEPCHGNAVFLEFGCCSCRKHCCVNFFVAGLTSFLAGKIPSEAPSERKSFLWQRARVNLSLLLLLEDFVDVVMIFAGMQFLFPRGNSRIMTRVSPSQFVCFETFV